MPARVPPAHTFELGLVMAGAVSAGAYTAGVLDFLFEALDAWEKRKRAGDATVPDHAVQIRVVSGASAGGIASALTAMVPFTGHHPINDLTAASFTAKPVNAEKNLLYRAWVEDIDIAGLLTTTDLQGGKKPIRSFLNADAVDNVALGVVDDVRDEIGKRKASAQPLPLPAYFANPLQVYLSLTNLRGVPYLINMQTAGGGVRGHRMMTHMDYAHFAVFGTNSQPNEPLPAGATTVNPTRPPATPEADGWSDLMNAALSTSAFPIGLRSRPFKNDISVYQSRLWPRAFNDDPSSPPLTIAPDIFDNEGRPYTFWTCDGGLINNEPLEYARVALSGAPDMRNPREATEANRALLMIDPFPDDGGRGIPADTESAEITALVRALFPALKFQARFKPHELGLALGENVFSRFLIAPVRKAKAGEETDLAASGLTGFSGFLDRRFRVHDFQLGRMNCQKFLRDHLCVHIDNPVVADWVKKLSETGHLDKYRTRTRDAVGNEKLDEDFVQIIPLMEDVVKRVEALPWPKLPQGQEAFIKALMPKLEQRLDAVLDGVVPSLMSLFGIRQKGLFGGLTKWLATKKIRSALLELAQNSVGEDLKKRGLG